MPGIIGFCLFAYVGLAMRVGNAIASLRHLDP